MRKLIFSLAAPLLLSAVAVAADDAAPPIASGAIPSGYVWYSGGSVAVGIGYTWGHGRRLSQERKGRRNQAAFTDRWLAIQPVRQRYAHYAQLAMDQRERSQRPGAPSWALRGGTRPPRSLIDLSAEPH